MRYLCETRDSSSCRGLKLAEIFRAGRDFSDLLHLQGARKRPGREDSSFSPTSFRSLLEFWVGARNCPAFCRTGQRFELAVLK